MGEPEEPARVRTDHVVPGGAQLLDRVRVAALERRAECPPVVGAEREDADEKAAAEEDGSAKARLIPERVHRETRRDDGERYLHEHSEAREQAGRREREC